MIAFLVGTIAEKYENTVVVDVNGVGYELTISNNTASTLPMVNETIKILTYLQVKEDGVSLYGFSTEEEKAMFLKLITISGIGPKLAITILSGMNLSDLVVAILNEDSNTLAKIKGLGKKSAERICLELKDKVSTASLSISDIEKMMSGVDEINENALNDAVETLINLGVNKNEAYRLARAKAKSDSTAEEIILQVLRDLGR